MFKELGGFGDRALATLNTKVTPTDNVGIEGYYHVVCRDKNGKLKWEEFVENQVVQVGKNLMLTALLSTTTTVTGPFLGLAGITGTTVSAGSFVTGATYAILVVGTTSFTSIGASANTVGVVFTATGAGSGTGTATLIGTFSPTDTMASHAGWTEFTNYTGNRLTPTFTTTNGGQTTAGSNVVTAAGSSVTFTISGAGGSIGGCFLVLGTGAVATKSDTNGTLYSAGAFSSVKTTTSGDTVAVTYSTTATS